MQTHNHSIGPQLAARRKTATKRRKAAKRYGPKAGEKVARAMHELKHGTLRSGGSGKKVRNRKQAIAIGLSEARKSGGTVPPPPKRKRKR